MKIYASEKMRLHRILQGLTIVELANKVEMSKQAVGQIERGNNGVGPANAKKIAEVLGVEFDEIFTFVERGVK
jgi:transcriptional regulator with XRE-family HTH domain